MPTHKEIKFLPYTPGQLYTLVADIEAYPEFLPWCIGARNRKRETDAGGHEVLWSDLIIGFKMVRERFTSKVTLHPPAQDGGECRIDVEYVNGPLKYLQNHWVFVPVEEGCEIDFFVDFEFRSRLLQKMIGALFHEAVSRMVGAFEKRAHALYGAPQQQTPAA